MITIGEMQISGMLTMLMLSVMLMFCVPHRSKPYGSFTRARWMMAIGTGLIGAQFLLQHSLGFRQLGITQAVLLNLIFFTPASLMCSMAILYLQRQGYIARKEWWIAGGICALTIVSLLATVLLDGVPIEEESTKLRTMEYVCAMLYVLMQGYIFRHQFDAYLRLKQVVDKYYDRKRHDLFGWMGWSMRTMAILALFVPVVVFMEGKLFVLFSIAYFFGITYSTISLYSYGISENQKKVEEAVKGRI